MPVTVRIPAMSLRRPALPLALVAALLPLPLAISAAACGGADSVAAPPAASDAAGKAAPAAGASAQSEDPATLTALATTVSEHDLDDLDRLYAPWAGDLDAMIERRVVRVLVPMSKTFYFLDGAQPRGISYDAAVMFEEKLNERLESGHLKVYAVMVPVTRDQLLEGLVAGQGDLAIGNITITPERHELVDFSDPVAEDIKEVVVTGPGSPAIATVDDLAGQEIYVRHSSSYFGSLTRLNERFAAEGKAAMTLTPAPEVLEDEDMLEMVNAGLVPIIVVDSHKADFWAQVFTDVVVHDDVAVATGQQIGWAFRKDSPELAAEVNGFVAEHKIGTLMGNILRNRYLHDTEYAERALAQEGRLRFGELAQIFQRYGEQYDLPWLLLAAQGYQESRLDQSTVSAAGAIGVMQLLPSTAADPNVGIPDIHEVENNIHAGAKYVRFIFEHYFADTADMDKLDQALFSFASYNAGPARIAQLRGKAADMGLDPDVWFRNVELVAAQEIGRETVQYVSNIYKYFIAYERMVAISDARQRARGGTTPRTP